MRQNIVIGMAEKCVDFKLKFFDVKNSLTPKLQNLLYLYTDLFLALATFLRRNIVVGTEEKSVDSKLKILT